MTLQARPINPVFIVEIFVEQRTVSRYASVTVNKRHITEEKFDRTLTSDIFYQ